MISIDDLLAQKDAIRGELARRHIRHFFKLVKPENVINWHHGLILDKLQLFVEGKIKNLIVCMPPQHGKSEICSRVLPAYILGKHPTKRIISTSYNAENSSKFNRDVQRIIDSDEFKIAFPSVELYSKSVRSAKEGAWLRNSDEFEIVGYGGYYKNAGVGGGITGRTADYAIIDDPIKGAADASSATIRRAIMNWYAQDLGTRLNNNSQQLVIMTRWHEKDLVGELMAIPEIMNSWTIISLPAIKENDKNPEDPRKIGEALWPEFQGIERLNRARALGERSFRCLYQQDPKANKDVLVYPEFDIIDADTFDNMTAGAKVYGLDFGYNDELALVCLRLASDRRLLIKEVIYKKGVTPDALIKELRAAGVGREIIVCDNSRPELIKHLRAAGFAAEPCEKGAGSVFTGIQLVKSFKLFIVADSDNLINEFNNYEWVTDDKGFATETPKGEKDHAADAVRYAARRLVALSRGAPATYVNMNLDE